MVTFLGMVMVQRMVTIKDMMTNAHPRDGGHPWERLEDFDLLEMVAVFRISIILMDGYLILGP